MEQLNLNLSPRTVTGKKVKRLRRDGIIPVHLFGAGTEPLFLQVDNGVLRWVLPRAGGNVPISVTVEGQDVENVCFVREVQRHPVTEELLHVDFLRVDVSQTMEADVPVILEGEAPAVRNMGGTLLQNTYSIRVESLPMSIPASITVDISALDDFFKTIRVGSIAVERGVSVLTDPDMMIVRVVPPRVEVAEEGEALEEAPEEVPEEGTEPEAGKS